MPGCTKRCRAYKKQVLFFNEFFVLWLYKFARFAHLDLFDTNLNDYPVMSSLLKILVVLLIYICRRLSKFILYKVIYAGKNYHIRATM